MKYHILHWVYVGVAALLVTCMAAVHGVMGESLFEIGSQELRKFWLLPVSLVAFVLCAWALWHREHIEHKIKHKTEAQKPPRHHRLTLAIAIGLLAMTALAQGLTAISMGHLAGEQLHHDYQVMLAVGGIAFLLLTLSLWRLKDKLFTIVAEVKDVEAKSWAFHASVIILSSPGDSELDIAQFKQAQNKFDAIWDDTKDWTKAIKEIGRAHV